MHKVKMGDTIVEVTFAIAVFAFVAIISISLMNNGIAKAQQALEINMARNEIDAQAEALRFIHNSFLSERNLSKKELDLNDSRMGNKWYTQLWQGITRDAAISNGGLAITANKVPPLNVTECKQVYDGWTENGNVYNSIYSNNAFVLNTRLLSPNTVTTGGNQNVIYIAKNHKDNFLATPLYPRIIFTRAGDNSDNNSDEMVEGTVSSSNTSTNNTQSYLQHLYRRIARVEGIWVLSVRDSSGFNNLTTTTADPSPGQLLANTPEYFDFHIRTCWYAPGRDFPTTIGTIIRLYNPEYVEASR